jgi:hypothetical protein
MSADYRIVSGNNDIKSDVVIDVKNVETAHELRGILHKESRNKDSEIIVKTILAVFISIIALPFIACDLYYAYNDQSCVQEYPNKININLKMFLLLSGYMLLSKVIIIIIGISSISYQYTDFINITVMILLGLLLIVYELFNVIWNIIGAVIFWGNIYKNDNCDNGISTYMFVSLIIKLFTNLMFIINLKNNDKKSK